MKSFIVATTLLLTLTLSTAASAYVGPGAGLSLLGALWALLVALGTALVFVLAWPLRKMLRRKRENKAQAREDPQTSESTSAVHRSPQESKGSRGRL